MTDVQILKNRVEFIIAKYGYKTSYAENMIYAIDQVNVFSPDSVYSIVSNIGVVKQCKDITVRLESGQFVQLHELEWNLYQLLGEYILNENPNYFNES